MSKGFARSQVKTAEELEREIETRMNMDAFTDDFDPPGEAFREVPRGTKVHGGGEYQKPHDDDAAETDVRFIPGGRDSAQEYLDEIDTDVQKYNSRVKSTEEQMPMHKILSRLAAGVDEALWKKAKDASQQAFGKIKWPFVMWWYKEHGGK